MNHTRPGFGSVPDYTIPGLAWVTSSVVGTSPVRFDFPKVTRDITIRNLGSGAGVAPNVHVGFTFNGVAGSNRYTIPSGSSENFEIRTQSIFLQSTHSSTNISILAGLTLIDSREMPTLTGSAVADGSPGSGWNGVG